MESETWISPHFTTLTFGTEPTDDQLIEVFRDRVDGWQISIAEELLRQIEASPTYPAMQHAGYALIAVVFSYFEMVGQIIGGQTKPKKDFVRGFRAVYGSTPLTDEQIGTIYNRIRCGMYHNGYTKCGVVINGQFTPTFAIDDGTVCLNPHSLVRDVRTHFGKLVGNLRQASHTVGHLKKLFGR